MSIISKLDEENETKQQNALLNQQLKMGMENIEALNSAYSQQRKLTHDFNNHLSVIRSLLESEDTAQAKDYTTNLLNTSVSVSRLFDSGNSIVDTLLTQKYNQAKDLGIKMQVLVEDLSGVSMSADKLVVVLSNLLDNAIEACTNTNGEKMIKVKFVLEDMGHILTVQNTADNAPNSEKGQFATTKADSLNHGYGIKNISSIMEDYGYPYTFDYKNGWFTFTAMMAE
ncbi:MAG: GHKL domain-containing protein [Oscillospiraceae bacterium]|nr:GHKL domain-containing protein [Oscillospiraceae bacterium]